MEGLFDILLWENYYLPDKYPFRYFYVTTQNASKIWANNPSSAAVMYRFLQFKGCIIKIATMATNILASQFKIPLSDYYSIYISPDVHADRVLKRIGLVNTGASREAIVYKARELNPEFPGIIDFSC